MATAAESSMAANGNTRPMTPSRDNDAPLPPVPIDNGRNDELDPGQRERLQHILSSDVSSAPWTGAQPEC
jgi:hypothetical protein